MQNLSILEKILKPKHELINSGKNRQTQNMSLSVLEEILMSSRQGLFAKKMSKLINKLNKRRPQARGRV